MPRISIYFLLGIFCGCNYAIAASEGPAISAQISTTLSMHSWLGAIEKINSASAEERMRIFTRLFKQDNQLFRKTAMAYLESKGYPIEDSLRLLRFTACGLFNPACDPYFSETIAEQLSIRYASADEDFLFLRAANLSVLDSKKAYAVYQQIIERNPRTPLKDELIRRLYTLASYSSDKATFSQWCKTQGITTPLYIDDKNTILSDLKVVRPLQVDPARIFIGKPVKMRALFTGKSDDGTGEATFQWYFSQTDVSSQLPFLENAFFHEGVHLVYMDTPSLRKAQSGFLGIVPVYFFYLEPGNGSRHSVSQPVSLRVGSIPYFPSSLYEVVWYIPGSQPRILNGNKQSVVFNKKGPCTIQVFIKFGLYTVSKELKVQIN